MSKAGLKLYTYLLTSAIADDPPVGTLVQPISNESIDLDRGEIDASTRGSGGWRINIPGLKNGSIEATLIVPEGTDTQFDAIFAAWNNASKIKMGFFNNPLTLADAQHGETGTVSVRGLHGSFFVTDFSEARELEGVNGHTVRFSPAQEDTTNSPPSYDTYSITLA